MRADAEQIQKTLVGQPTPPANDLVPHDRDVRDDERGLSREIRPAIHPGTVAGSIRAHSMGMQIMRRSTSMQTVERMVDAGRYCIDLTVRQCLLHAHPNRGAR